MKITLNDQAEQRLWDQIQESKRKIKLVYDVEECGCPVNGIAQLWLVRETMGDDMRLHDRLPIYCDPRDEVFFEDELRLDYDVKKRCYSLFSDQQTYHPALILRDQG